MKTRDPDFEAKVHRSFAQQAVMATLGAELVEVAPGVVTIDLPFRADLTQQDGYLHAGVVTAVVDSACGYAAHSLMPPGAGVLSVEFKVNLLRPARGRRFRAIGRVIKAGRRLMVCQGDVLVDPRPGLGEGAERSAGPADAAAPPDAPAWHDAKAVATMTATMIVMEGAAER